MVSDLTDAWAPTSRSTHPTMSGLPRRRSTAVARFAPNGRLSKTSSRADTPALGTLGHRLTAGASPGCRCRDDEAPGLHRLERSAVCHARISPGVGFTTSTRLGPSDIALPLKFFRRRADRPDNVGGSTTDRCSELSQAAEVHRTGRLHAFTSVSLSHKVSRCRLIDARAHPPQRLDDP